MLGIGLGCRVYVVGYRYKYVMRFDNCEDIRPDEVSVNYFIK